MFKVGCLLVVVAVILKFGNPQLTQISDKYHMSNVVLELLQAYDVCKRNGYTLLTEKNENDTLAINAAINAAGYTNRNYWLFGVNATQGEFDADWIWIETGEVFDYTNWEQGYPIADTNCLLRYYLKDQSPPSQWRSVTCISQLWFICQNL